MSKSKPYYKKWWFTFIVAPIFVGLVLHFIIDGNKSNKITENTLEVGRDLNIQGDLVQGNKYEINEGSTVFKELNKPYIQAAQENLKKIKLTSDKSLSVLIQYFDSAESTRLFALQLKQIMQNVGINSRVVSAQVIGLPDVPYPIVITYDSITMEDAKNFANILTSFLLKRESRSAIVIKEGKINEEYEILVQFFKQVYFLDDGKIFFNESPMDTVK